MAYRFAAHFRIWEVERWLRSTTWRQFEAWLAYYGIEPFGDERTEWQNSRMAMFQQSLWSEAPEFNAKMFFWSADERESDAEDDDAESTVDVLARQRAILLHG